jgi:hypothetical protein
MADCAPPNAPRTDFPMGCNLCHKEPATHLSARNLGSEYGWSTFLIGDKCAHKNGPDASAWLYRLVPDNGEECGG